MLEDYVPHTTRSLSRNYARGCGHNWQNEHGRIFDGHLNRNQLLRTVQESLGPRARASGSSGAVRRRGGTGADLALGSDTGGSIRCPASFCGVVGLKPTYGRVSRSGLVSYGNSMEQIGPIARTVEACATLFEVIAGYDPLDSTSRDVPVPHYVARLTDEIAGLELACHRIFLAKALILSWKTQHGRQ